MSGHVTREPNTAMASDLADRASLDGALSATASLEDLRAGLSAHAADAGPDRLARYMGAAFTIRDGKPCARALPEAYVERRMETVRALRALRQSFLSAPGNP